MKIAQLKMETEGIPSEIRAEAQAWLAADPDPSTKAQLADLLSLVAEDPLAAEEVRSLFSGRLRFGTAGLRAPLGPGPLRMNLLVVRQATAAVMATLPPGATVVVAHDARHRSADFAAEACCVVSGFGGTALSLGQLPTPVAAHAISDRSASAGIVITASHNPRGDNGFKLYAADGAQIIPPADAEVEARMTQLLPSAGDEDNSKVAGRIHRLGAEAVERYVADIAWRLARFGAAEQRSDEDAPSGSTARPPAASSCPEKPLRVVYTPLHGVGAPVLLRLFQRLGLSEPLLVPSQAEADPEFPTIAFPNPEEPGALDAAVHFAEALHADVVLANDPDADRLAVVLPEGGGFAPALGERRPSADSSDSSGLPPPHILSAESAASSPPARRWRTLTGDELGVLLADHLLRLSPASAPPAGVAASDSPAAPSPTAGNATSGNNDLPLSWLLAASVVSSRMLRSIAAAAGVAFTETLTGFKWIARAGDNRPEHLLFGYEEALGYAVCEAVRDKDGLSAAALFVQLTLSLRAQGLSPLERLDELARQHGVHLTSQVSLRLPDSPSAVQAAARLRASPPRQIAGQDVSSFVDHSVSPPERPASSPAPLSEAAHSSLPPTDMLVFYLEHGDRVIVRPSGTEPKLKVYLEVIQPIGDGDLESARSLANRRLGELEYAVAQLLEVS